MKVVTIIQARTSSSRLRNKVLLNFNGKTLLGQVIDSVKSIKTTDEIWVATSNNDEDDLIELISKENDVKCFRGSLDDVRSRFAAISKEINADIIVRVTADNPFTESSYVDQMIACMKCHKEIDYVSMNKSMILDGTGSEVFTARSLNKAIMISNHVMDLEHVTQVIIHNAVFKKEILTPADPDFLSKKAYFLGVDTFNDYVRNINILHKYSSVNTLKKIISQINKNEKVL